ncbi:hypothetical protein EYF80_039893 [Liparis tanakae]|uniref:Uncharacterized protein n=1 Tax=Liparis tanakae TaxID=230148 RepID=A0A4Z2GAD1_9TELE|nr:hypothetical protein EYF80_039893 [Liparis tanakae]
MRSRVPATSTDAAGLGGAPDTFFPPPAAVDSHPRNLSARVSTHRSRNTRKDLLQKLLLIMRFSPVSNSQSPLPLPPPRQHSALVFSARVACLITFRPTRTDWSARRLKRWEKRRVGKVVFLFDPLPADLVRDWPSMALPPRSNL